LVVARGPWNAFTMAIRLASPFSCQKPANALILPTGRKISMLPLIRQRLVGLQVPFRLFDSSRQDLLQMPCMISQMFQTDSKHIYFIFISLINLKHKIHALKFIIIIPINIFFYLSTKAESFDWCNVLDDIGLVAHPHQFLLASANVALFLIFITSRVISLCRHNQVLKSISAFILSQLAFTNQRLYCIL
jgi:hypothetical protein